MSLESPPVGHSRVLLRPALIIAIVSAVWLFAGFITYSVAFKDWCKTTISHSFFSDAFSKELKGCLQRKKWYEL